MAKLKLGPIVDEKPVKVTSEFSGAAYRELAAYAEIHGRETGQPVQDPSKLVPHIVERFISTDRGFAKARKSKGSPIPPE